MRSEVTVTFKDAAPLRMDLDKEAAMAPDAARAWLDRQFTDMGCEPLRPTGKVLTADKVVVVAQAAGPARFADPLWAQNFARAASAALGKPVVHVDVPSLTIGY
ncbi:hypothetical protein [Ramlibacter sp.]|uniref:hypothetical protein n=1 Tax=Ramlibacter sp. TaxID=1917967 RepID=UPI002CE2AAE6|nr:hypothetical protein [Ramlibacter sp.]HWI82738.1 hypothetical protein [Ramlibacter sp.]